MILWPGYCPPISLYVAGDIAMLKKEFPDAQVLVHPECSQEVAALADKVLSTGGMIATSGKAPRTHLSSEPKAASSTDSARKIPASDSYRQVMGRSVPNMKRISLEKILWSLQDMMYEVRVPEELRTRATVGC